MYGKLFGSMYDGTLVEDWRALITFQQFIVLCDADGTVDMTPHAISRRTGIPIEHIEAGIKILESPDPHSRTAAEQGCRIQRLDDHRPWGWTIVNHEKYKFLQDSDTVRAQNRERKRRQRDREKESQVVTGCHTPSRHTDTDTDTDKPKDNRAFGALCAKEFERWWLIYPKKVKKKTAKATWMIKKPDADLLIADVENRQAHDGQWKRGFIPHPTTYLNGERWNDELTEERHEENNRGHKPTVTDHIERLKRQASEREERIGSCSDGTPVVPHD